MPVVLEPDAGLLIRALRLLAWSDCEYVLFHVIELPVSTATYRETVGYLVADSYKKLESLRNWLMNEGYDVALKVVAARDVVAGILEELDRNHYSLVLLQRKKRGRLGLLSKSTTQRLLKRLATPILIMPID